MNLKILNQATICAVVSIVSLALLVGVSNGQDLAGVKCVVNGEAAASADVFTEYKGAKVYFAGDKELALFKVAMKEDGAAYQAKANHQLLLTGQFVQKACPIAAKPVAEGKSVDLFGVTVGFCCAGCVGKVNKTEDAGEKVSMVFGEVAFSRGFELKPAEINLENLKCPINPSKGVTENATAEWNGHQVYFCCNGCKGKFEKDSAKFSTQANFQLVTSKQVKQVACPISGSDVTDDQSSEVAGVSVKYCCKNCKAKVTTSNEAAQLEHVFGEKGFAKGFKD